MINTAMDVTKAKAYFKKKEFALANNLDEMKIDPVA
jgi:hypothetical protein